MITKDGRTLAQERADTRIVRRLRGGAGALGPAPGGVAGGIACRPLMICDGSYGAPNGGPRAVLRGFLVRLRAAWRGAPTTPAQAASPSRTSWSDGSRVGRGGFADRGRGAGQGCDCRRSVPKRKLLRSSSTATTITSAKSGEF